jgi:hypothetical protein
VPERVVLPEMREVMFAFVMVALVMVAPLMVAVAKAPLAPV